MPNIRLTRRIGTNPQGTILNVSTNAANWFVNKNMATHTDNQPATPTTNTKPQQPDQRPPTAGPGSGRQAWATYATHNGHHIPDGMTRNDIINLIDA